MNRAAALFFDLNGTLLDISRLQDAVVRTCADIATRQPGLACAQLLQSNSQVWQAYWPEVERKWTLGILDDATVGLEAWKRTLRACGCDDDSVARMARETHRRYTRGQLPREHQVWCTAGRRDLPRWAGSTQVAVPTLLERARGAGLKSAAIVGDHLLHHVLRTESADVRWPPAHSDGVSVGSKRDAYGYATNAAVEPHLLEALGDPTIDLVFGQLNEADTLGHLGGPLDPSTLECCAATDTLVGEILEALRPEWQRALVIVVSDHDMVHRSGAPAIDLLDDATMRGVVRDVFVDGDAALVQFLPGVDPGLASDALAAVDYLTWPRSVSSPASYSGWLSASSAVCLASLAER